VSARHCRFERFLFINADLSIHLHRPPRGEWIGLDARTLLHPGGTGIAESVVHDTSGPVGRGISDACGSAPLIAGRFFVASRLDSCVCNQTSYDIAERTISAGRTRVAAIIKGAFPMSSEPAVADAVTNLPTGTWTVDKVHSSVEFQVKHLAIATVKGQFTEFQGTLESGPDGAKAYGTVKVASVDTREPQRD